MIFLKFKNIVTFLKFKNYFRYLVKMADVNVPVYFQTESQYIKSSDSPVLAGIKVKWNRFKKSAASAMIIKIILIIVIIFVAVTCWLNFIAYLKIRDATCDSIVTATGAPSTTSTCIVKDGISDTWALFGAIVNAIFGLILSITAIIMIISLFKNEKKSEKQSRKLVGTVIDGARLKANEAIRSSISKIEIKPDDIDATKSFIVTSTTAVVDNVLDRYKNAVLEGIMDE
jgi:hypothetical protein